MTKSAGPMRGCRWAAECNLVAPAGAGVNDFILMGITTVLSCGVLWNKCCTRRQRELGWGNELCHCLLMPCSKHWDVFSCYRLCTIIIFYKQQLPISLWKTQTLKVMLLKMRKLLSNPNRVHVCGQGMHYRWGAQSWELTWISLRVLWVVVALLSKDDFFPYFDMISKCPHLKQKKRRS